MARNIINALRVESFLRLNSEKLFGRGVVRFYHPDMGKFPDVPLQIHDSEYQMFPESGQPLNLFVPDLSELDYNEITNEMMIRVNKAVVNGRLILQKTSEINLILISNQAIQTVREVPNKILKSNYFVSSDGGIIAVEKMFPIEKLMSTVKEKLSEVSSKISSTKEIPPQVIKVWERVKEKLPSWQNAIAAKLQEFQNRINKGTEKKEA